jgi:hypothetical protein
LLRVGSVQPAIRQLPSSVFALGKKLIACFWVQPLTAYSQRPGSVAASSKSRAVESVQPRYLHEPSSTVATLRKLYAVLSVHPTSLGGHEPSS